MVKELVRSLCVCGVCNKQQCRIVFPIEKSYYFSSGYAAVRGTGKLSSVCNSFYLNPDVIVQGKLVHSDNGDMPL